MVKKNTVLYIVVPCYNEEEVLEETTKQLKTKVQTLIRKNIISNQSKIMYIDDGSKDNTWKMIKDFHQKESIVTGISLSRNRGHQNALVAGLMTAKEYADVVISMDADLQDDINAIDDMLEKYYSGCDIVYGVRNSREKDSFLKRTTANLFYRIMKAMGTECINNHADFRLTSKRVLKELSNYKEVNLFLRGIFPLIGFKSEISYYERKKRLSGKSKYSISKMLNFAIDGITSFSVKPLRLIILIGFIIFTITLLLSIGLIIQTIKGISVSGWQLVSLSIWFLGGVQMISVGIIGEYIGKIYNETKARPRYIISDDLNEKKRRREKNDK